MQGVNARLAAKTVQSGEGWQESLTRDDELGEQDVSALRALFDIALADRGSLLLNLHYVKDESDNKANTAYDGTINGLGLFNNPYTPLDEYILPTGANFGQAIPWHSTGGQRRRGLDQLLHQPDHRPPVRPAPTA